jgi:hypothetical protein
MRSHQVSTNVHPRAFKPDLDKANGERLTLSGCKLLASKLCKTTA